MQMPNPSKNLTISGKISYNESLRAYTTIRLKKRIVDLFPSLQQNQEWQYHVEFHENPSTLLKRITEAAEKKEGTPLLLFIYSSDHGPNTEN